jgi:methanogenic corrinoid protein MtbC1
MVGGAVVTQDFANSIGAKFYAKDAMQAVELLKGYLN